MRAGFVTVYHPRSVKPLFARRADAGGGRLDHHRDREVREPGERRGAGVRIQQHGAEVESRRGLSVEGGAGMVRWGVACADIGEEGGGIRVASPTVERATISDARVLCG